MSKETLTLTTPLLVNGKELSELQYDTSLISINDLAAIETERSQALGNKGVGTIRIAHNDFLLHILIGMHAIIKCNPSIDIEDLKRIKGYDLTQISLIGTRFFTPPDVLEPKNSNEQQEDIQEPSTVQ